jgi:hypothetical protein
MVSWSNFLMVYKIKINIWLMKDKNWMLKKNNVLNFFILVNRDKINALNDKAKNDRSI